MALPLYLAMRSEEMEDFPSLPRHFGRMVWGKLPAALPAGAMLVLTDRISRDDPRHIAAAVSRLNCGSVLLDFEDDPTPDTLSWTKALSQALTCPLAAPPDFSADTDCAVFLPPCPLHVPLAEYLKPWQGRDIWLDVTLRQQTITVTASGTRYGSSVPADRHEDGWFDEVLLCRCVTEIADDQARFILFDTADTLKAKLNQAAFLGVTKAVGLYQELHSIM